MCAPAQVALPYMQSKLENMYNRHRRQARAPSALRVMQRPHDIEPAADQVQSLMIVVATEVFAMPVHVGVQTHPQVCFD